MPAGDYIKSYYAATARALTPFPPLLGSVAADVCVVGAGIAGCSAALHLAERGYSVVLLEEHRVGWGASGRSGGQALPGFSLEQHQLAALVGRDTARALWNVTVEGLDLIRDLIRRHAINCDWVDGHLHAAVKPRHREELLVSRDELSSEYGYDTVRLIERPELRDLLASDRYIAGLHDARSGHLHPLNYTLGLAGVARKLGVVIHEGTRALRYEGRSPIVVHAANGNVRCRHLVLCGNIYIDGAAPALERTILGVGTYIVATEPLGAERARALIRNNMAVADLSWIIDYFRLSADHRLLFGGRVSYSGLDPAATSGLTRQRMVRVFPQLEDVRIDYSWGGYLDITMNRAPHFGRLAPDVYFLQGFSGHGITLTGIAGKLVAAAVAGTAERFDLFTRIPHRAFPGGRLLRRPALVLAMLYYRLRDLL